ncbi:MAG: glycosyltransferase [Alteraurantiacibacter sp.]
MRILALTEHFLPRIAGTAMTVHKTATALAARGHDVTLIAPNPAFPDIDAAQNFSVRRIGPDLSPHGAPSREDRYAFCAAANAECRRMIAAGEVDVVHVMFGLFLMEILDTEAYAANGVASVAMIHNLPPHECAVTWDASPLHKRLADKARLVAVARKNRARLHRHDYARYLVPSEQVAGLAREVLPGRAIEVVEHGVTDTILSLMKPPALRRPADGEPVRLLTVGGFVPHKRQHLTPDIVARLSEQGVAVEWTLAGAPGRVPAYFDALKGAIAARGMEDSIKLRTSLSDQDLAAAYDAAHIYVQPSTEEGFCLTALDAAAAGLPVIGSPAGAIPRIVKASQGKLVPSEPAALAAAIAGHVSENVWSGNRTARVAHVCETWNWDRVAADCERIYRDALAKSGTAPSPSVAAGSQSV